MGSQIVLSSAPPAVRLTREVQVFLRSLEDEFYEVALDAINFFQEGLPLYMERGAPGPLLVPYENTVLFVRFDRVRECYWIFKIECGEGPDVPPDGGSREYPTVTESILSALGISPTAPPASPFARAELSLAPDVANASQDMMRLSATSFVVSDDGTSFFDVACSTCEQNTVPISAGFFARVHVSYPSAIYLNWIEANALTKKTLGLSAPLQLAQLQVIQDCLVMLDTKHHGEQTEPGFSYVQSSKK